MPFKDIFADYDWDIVKERIYSARSIDVERALAKAGYLTPEEFLPLLSPAAEAYLPQMIELSRELTFKRFGKTIHLYIPLYLSNKCNNVCTYCGFSFTNKNLKRITLTPEQIELEAKAIKRYGFDHVVIVTGEDARDINVEYLTAALRVLKKYFSQVSVEVQPLKMEDYAILRNEGMHAVIVYQETYNQKSYAEYHLKGRKRNFFWRLETPERAAQAGVRKIGMGVLLGLEDWRTDAFFLALHLDYMRRHYWQTMYSVSFPRLRPAEGFAGPKVEVNNKALVQLITAFRLFDADLDLVLSTREPAKLRDLLMTVGITTMSAGSRTEPGAYAIHSHALKQFEISDTRSPQQVAQAIKQAGFTPVWKDWEAELV